MFCQECGYRNINSGAGMFCEYCGARLENTTAAQPQPQPPRSAFEDSAYNQFGAIAIQKLRSVDLSKAKRLDQKTKSLLIGAAAGVAVLIALVIAGSALSNPKRTAKAYFESFVAGNYEKAYNYLSLPDSKFLNKQAFREYMKQENASALDIASYEIVDPYAGRSGVPPDESQIAKTYLVNYILRGESSQRHLTVNLVRQDKKKFLFFNNYKVGLDDLVVRDFVIYAPDGISLSFGGVPLAAQENTTGSYESLKVYAVGAAFKGKYMLRASSSLFEDLEMEIAMDRRDYEVLNELEVKESIRASIATNAYNVFAAMVQTALKQEELRSIENISGILTAGQEPLNAIQERYDNLTSHVSKDDGTGLKSVHFAGFDDETRNNTLDSDGRYRCDIALRYTYVKISKDWWTQELTQEDPSSERDGSARFAFAYEDGGWKIVSFDTYSLYY